MLGKNIYKGINRENTHSQTQWEATLLPVHPPWKDGESSRPGHRMAGQKHSTSKQERAMQPPDLHS